MKKIYSSLILVSFVAMFFGNSSFGQNELVSGYAESSAAENYSGSTFTSGTNLPVVTINVSSASSNVLVIASFEVAATVGTPSTPELRLAFGADGSPTATSTPIQRYLAAATDKGLGSLLHIFTTPGSGSQTFRVQHLADGQAINTKATLVAIEMGTASISLGNRIVSYSGSAITTNSSTYSSDAGFTSSALQLSIQGDIYVSASFNVAKSGAGSDVEGGEYVLQSSTDNTNWSSIGQSITRSTNTNADIGASSLVYLVKNVPALSDRYFRLAHRKIAGTGSIATSNVSLAVVGLSHSGGAFPGFVTSGSSSATTDANWATALGQTDSPNHDDTKLFMHSQFNASVTGTVPATVDYKFQVTGSGYTTQESETLSRYLSSTTAVGSGALVGLFDQLQTGVTYTASLQHKSPSSGTALTSSNIVLCGFQLSDHIDLSWTGTSSSDWSTATNWNPQVAPSSSASITIPSNGSNAISIDEVTSCNDLTIASGATPSIADNGALTVGGDLSNSGTLTINSSASGSGSLIVEGTSTGNIQYNSYMPGADSWHLISSPVVGQDIGDVLTNITGTNGIATKEVESVTYYAMSDYDESINQWKDFFQSSVAGNFISGLGYQVLRSTVGNIAFVGTVETSNVSRSITLSGPGWNCIGNPYPSGIFLNNSADANDNVLEDNLAALDGNFTAIYYWDGDATTPAYVEVNNADGAFYVSPVQGFFVRAASATTITINPATRTHSSSGFKSASSPWPRIKLFASLDDTQSTTRISFIPNMTRGLDVSYDAGMFKSNPNLSLYTKLVEDNGVDFGHQCLPEDYDNLIIPVGIDANTGDVVKFTAETINLPDGVFCYLEDRDAGTYTQLDKEGSSYSVQLTTENLKAGTFFIHTSAKTLGIDDVNLTEEEYKFIASEAEGTLRIIGPVKEGTSLKIYNVAGQQLMTRKLDSSFDNTLSITGLKKGIYLVQLQKDQELVNRKIFW